MTEPDPMGDTSRKATAHLTVALTVAARLVEVQMHKRAQQTRAEQERSAEATRTAQQQLRAEAEVVKFDLRDVGRREWWDNASVDQVAGSYAAARAFAGVDPELTGIAGYMATEIGRRYGVDADQLVVANAEATRAFTDRGITAPEVRLGDREEADVAARVKTYVDSIEQRAAAGVASTGPGAAAERDRTGRESVEAAALMAEADAIDRVVYADGVVTAAEAGQDLPRADVAWGDGERLQALSDRLDKSPGVSEAAKEARKVAAVAQARPVTEAGAAVKTAVNAPKARVTVDRGAERGRGR